MNLLIAHSVSELAVVLCEMSSKFVSRSSGACPFSRSRNESAFELRSKLAIGRSVEDKHIFSLVWSIGTVAKILIFICVLVKLLNLCDHLSDVVSSESR